jgi:hypothetical protein
MKNKKNSRIFIIGAARSGTNILRDTLYSLDGVTTWPCDEINLIFRHGNKNMPYDEFDQAQARPKVKKFIQNEFLKLEKKYPNHMVLEKTCANSLRVPFLNEIFPNSKFIFIVRNGYDVTASAKKRWKSSIELDYLIKKVKFVPKADIPYYLIQFAKNRIKQFFSNEKRMSIWGPVYKGMHEDSKIKPLEEVSAKQWARSVGKAYKDLLELEIERTYFLNYESFVKDPGMHMKNISVWLNQNWTDEEIKKAIKNIRPTSIGKAENKIKNNKAIQDIIEPVMKQIYSKIQ